MLYHFVGISFSCSNIFVSMAPPFRLYRLWNLRPPRDEEGPRTREHCVCQRAGIALQSASMFFIVFLYPQVTRSTFVSIRPCRRYNHGCENKHLHNRPRSEVPGHVGTRLPFERERICRVVYLLEYGKKECPHVAHIGCYVTPWQYGIPSTPPRSPHKDSPVFSKLEAALPPGIPAGEPIQLPPKPPLYPAIGDH